MTAASISEVVGISLVLLFYLAAGTLVAYVGVKPTWRVVDAGFKRLIYGPAGREPKRRDCTIQHLIAKTEIEIYKQIVSESIEEHLRNCQVVSLKTSTWNLLRLHDKHLSGTERDTCSHDWRVQMDLSGERFEFCSDCGEARR